MRKVTIAIQDTQDVVEHKYRGAREEERLVRQSAIKAQVD